MKSLVLSLHLIIVNLFYIPKNEHWISCVQIFSNQISIRQRQIMSSVVLPMCLTRSHSSMNRELNCKYYISIHTHSCEWFTLIIILKIYSWCFESTRDALFTLAMTQLWLIYFFSSNVRWDEHQSSSNVMIHSLRIHMLHLIERYRFFALDRWASMPINSFLMTRVYRSSSTGYIRRIQHHPIACSSNTSRL
jgi:hypothetical protein